jgi:hypothetical protein
MKVVVRPHSNDQKAEPGNQPAMWSGRRAIPEKYLYCEVTLFAGQRHRSMRSYSCSVHGSAWLIIMLICHRYESFPGFLIFSGSVSLYVCFLSSLIASAASLTVFAGTFAVPRGSSRSHDRMVEDRRGRFQACYRFISGMLRTQRLLSAAGDHLYARLPARVCPYLPCGGGMRIGRVIHWSVDLAPQRRFTRRTG